VCTDRSHGTKALRALVRLIYFLENP